MGKYDVNFKKLIKDILPTAIRKNIIEFIHAPIEPIIRLYFQFTSHRKEVAERLSYNAQYPNLQRRLNERFDREDRRIEVRDNGDNVPDMLIYPNAEQKPIILGQVILRPSSAWGYQPFTVIVPASILTGDTEKQTRRILDEYKFAGTKYKIITK